MKFFHLSDLHIGKQLHHYNLREDQEHILAEVLSYAASIHPDAIVIAGDIYDKSVPSAEAVSLFDEFLTALAKIEPVIPVLIISGIMIRHSGLIMPVVCLEAIRFILRVRLRRKKRMV